MALVNLTRDRLSRHRNANCGRARGEELESWSRIELGPRGLRPI